VITMTHFYQHPLFIAAALLASPFLIVSYWLIVFLAVG